MSDASMSDASVWAFGPPETEILVENADLLLAHLPVFLTGWPVRRVGGAGIDQTEIHIAEQPAGRFSVALRGGGQEQPCDDAFAAADALADALVARLVARRADLASVRAGGVRIGPGLAVLLGGPHSGKSTVALQLAAAGYRLFAEGRLALRPSKGASPIGVCLGLTPRVRLPVPADCGGRFAEYVESFTEMRNEETAYLKLWEGEAASFGEEAPVAALVILDRRDSGPATLTPASQAEIADALLSSADTVDTAFPAAPCTGYRVQFSASRDAASALVEMLRPRRD